jgi:hypothetical protein
MMINRLVLVEHILNLGMQRCLTLLGLGVTLKLLYDALRKVQIRKPRAKGVLSARYGVKCYALILGASTGND